MSFTTVKLNLISGIGALTMKSSTNVTIQFTLSVCMYATMEEPINQTFTKSDTDKFSAKGLSHSNFKKKNYTPYTLRTDLQATICVLRVTSDFLNISPCKRNILNKSGME